MSVPGALLGGVYLGPTFAMTQTLVRPSMRALASAILLFIINLIGLGLGPTVVGFLSERLKPTYGDESVRYALLWVVVIGAAWATLHYLLAARTLRRGPRSQERSPSDDELRATGTRRAPSRTTAASAHASQALP